VACLEEINALLDGRSTDVARRLNSGVGAVLTAAVSTLEDDRADVLLAQRTVDGVCELFHLPLDSGGVTRRHAWCSRWPAVSFYKHNQL